MGKSSPSPPPPPDYARAAAEQGAANIETARLQGRMSNPNVYGPLGNQLVSWGDNDQPTIRQSLTPDAMATLESQQNVQRQLANLASQGATQAQAQLGTPFQPNLPALQTEISTAGLPGRGALDLTGLPSAPITPGMTAQQALSARMEPDLARSQEALRTRLINQGLRPGGEAYNTEMELSDRAATDQRLQAAAAGIGLDQAARTAAFSEALQGGSFQQTARNQAYNEAANRAQFANTAQQQSLLQQLGLYQQPLNQITSLMSGSQQQMPQFQGYEAASVAPPPIFAAAQATERGAMDQYGIAQNAANARTKGMYDLLGAAATAAGYAYGGPAGGLAAGTGANALLGQRIR